MSIDYRDPAFAFPKGDLAKERRKQVRDRERRRLQVSQAVRRLDGQCMDMTCQCKHDRKHPMALELSGCHIENRRAFAAWLDREDNEITLCCFAHHKFDNGGEDADGRYLTALQYKNYVLDQWVGDPRYRWRVQHNRIRQELGLPSVEELARVVEYE